MSDTEPKAALPLLSPAEEEVWRGLQMLPPDYKLDWGKRILLRGEHEEFPPSYRPDFEISGPNGRQLLIEALSDSGLSFLNLLRLVNITEQIRAAGKEFLILVWGTEQLPPKANAIPEFGTLPLRTAATDADVVRVVTNEFAGMDSHAA